MNQPSPIKLASAKVKTTIVMNASQEISSLEEKRRIRLPTSLTIQPLIFIKDLYAMAVPAKMKIISFLQHMEQRLHLLMSQKKLDNCIKMHNQSRWQFHQAHKHSILFSVIQLLVHASILMLLYDFLIVVCKKSLVMK